MPKRAAILEIGTVEYRAGQWHIADWVFDAEGEPLLIDGNGAMGWTWDELRQIAKDYAELRSGDASPGAP